jgi:hypothetical protein
VGIVGQDRVAGGSPGTAHGPVVRGAFTEVAHERRGVLDQAFDCLAGRRADRIRHREPVRIIRFEGGQGFRSIRTQDVQAVQLRRPAGQHHPHVIHKRQHVDAFPVAGYGPQQGKLVSGAPDAVPASGVDPVRVRFDDRALGVRHGGDMPGSGPMETDPAGQPVDPQGPGAVDLGEAASDETPDHVQLVRAILPMAEPETVPGVFGAAGADVGDPVGIAADRDPVIDSGDFECAGGDWKAAAEEETEKGI